ncbi:GNAT family N-acetyltransferase [Novosphingobium gossypii]|uniref:GNAT family N-acetyltransferase n=1 Tax=Novosphingobium gossypii TaxID=1604774 RepID=UPI003D197F28
MDTVGSGQELECKELTTADQLSAAVPVMRVLRPHLEPSDEAIVRRLRCQMEQGYRLLALRRGTDILALAGFRIQENLVFGRFLYLDDLVVAIDARKQGHAETLLAAVREIAITSGLDVLALDTALTNTGAQRVYHRAGYETVAYHLIQRLDR